MEEAEMECVICKGKAIRLYEDEPSCGRISCELQMQEGLDYMKDHANS